MPMFFCAKRRHVFLLISSCTLTQKQIDSNLDKHLLVHLRFSSSFGGEKMSLGGSFDQSMQTKL